MRALYVLLGPLLLVCCNCAAIHPAHPADPLTHSHESSRTLQTPSASSSTLAGL